MKQQLFLLFISIGLAINVYTQDIVDFTYSKYIQKDNVKASGVSDISIHPDTNIIGGYDFPEACLIAKKLNESILGDSTEIQNFDQDAIVDELRKQFVQLLRVSEKIKKKKNNIAELAKLYNTNSNTTQAHAKDIELLRKYQDKLAAINEQIRTKTEYLQTLVYDSVKNSENNDLVMSALDYQIQFLGLKLDYLLQQQKKSAISQSSSPQDAFASFFVDLKRKFDSENQLIDDLNTIIQNYNEIGILKSKINRLKGEVEIADMMLEEKQVCAKERDEIRKFQRNEGEIKQLMTNLREKKIDKSNINNKYCEGVVKKLEDRVKKVLMTYDYTFECAEGLEDLKQKRNVNQRELTDAWNRLKELENNIGMDDYKIKFEQNRRYIKAKHQQITSFFIPTYHHNIQDLDVLIQKTQNQLDQAREKKSNTVRPAERKNTDFKAIHQLVSQIKSLKGQYCFEYERYQSKAQDLWSQVHKSQAQLSYQQKIRSLYEQQLNELRGLEMAFHDIRHFISSKIQMKK